MKKYLWSTGIGFIVFFQASAVMAQSALEFELDVLAREVAKHLTKHGKKEIQIGDFVLADKDRPPTGAGAGIRSILRDRFRALSVRTSDDATWRLEGTFQDVDDQQSKGLALAIQSRLIDRVQNKVLPLPLAPRGVFGDASLMMVMGTTVDLAPNQSRQQRDEVLRISIDQPKTSLTHVSYYRPDDPQKSLPSVAANAPRSKFRMDILAKNPKGYVPRPSEIVRDQAYVRLERGDVYAVRLINDYDFEIAAQLTIDGIGVFQFSEEENPVTGRPFHSIIVSPKSQATVYGWFVTQKKSDEFLVTEYARSAAAELKQTGSVGIITASFAASWEKGKMPPMDEPVDPVQFAREVRATARGLRIGSETEPVSRQIGVVRGGVTIRYNR